MKKSRKFLISTLSVLGLCSLTIASATLANTATASADVVPYEVYGASVRIKSEGYNPGVKFHVVMTESEFDKYGEIDATTGKGKLDEGVKTYTLLLPEYLTGGEDLTIDFGEENDVELSISNTSNLWNKATLDGVDYMQTITYLYNIPASDYGTELAVRGYIDNKGTPVYTEQVNGISMSYVAEVEYEDRNSALTANEKSSLKATYLDKTITYHVEGETTTESLQYNETAQAVPNVAEKQADNDYFVGWYTRSGKAVDLTAPIKNSVEAYAVYREAIVLSAETPSFNVADYQRAESDTVESMTLTLKGTEYDLGTAVTDGADYETLRTAYANHGEGEMKVTLSDASGTYTLNLPALVVTEDISTLDRFNVMRDYNGMYSQSNVIYGYFRITDDLSTNDTISTKNGTGAKTFKATIDGLDHTYVGGALSTYGLFGAYMVEASLKNWTIECNNYYNHDGSSCMLATQIRSATFENITLKVARIAGSTSEVNYNSAAANQGLIATSGVAATTFTNVTIEFGYSTNETSRFYKLRSLFGFALNGKGNYEDIGDNTYNGLYINENNGVKLEYLGTNNVELEEGTYQHVTLQDEVNDGAVIYYNGERLYKIAETASLAKQNVILDGKTTVSLDLGDYADETIVSITAVNGAFNLGTNPSALDVTAWTASAYDNWGAQEIVVKTQIDDDTQRIITIPVLAATAFISTAEELMAFSTTEGKTETTGYYMLTENIDCANVGTFAGGYNTRTFKGVLDGNGKEVSNITVGDGGIFGTVWSLTVKNVDFTDVTYQHASGAYVGLFASWVRGSSTFENINITIKSYDGLRTSDGALCVLWDAASTLRDVIIDASEATTSYNQTVILGTNADGNLTCDNVEIKLKSLNNVYVGQDSDGSTTYISFDDYGQSQDVTVTISATN